MNQHEMTVKLFREFSCEFVDCSFLVEGVSLRNLEL